MRYNDIIDYGITKKQLLILKYGQYFLDKDKEYNINILVDIFKESKFYREVVWTDYVEKLY